MDHTDQAIELFIRWQETTSSDAEDNYLRENITQTQILYYLELPWILGTSTKLFGVRLFVDDELGYLDVHLSIRGDQADFAHAEIDTYHYVLKGNSPA